MRYLLSWGVLLGSGLVGCEQHPGQPANAALPAAVVAPTTAVPPDTALDSYWVRDSLCFGRYLTAHGPEVQAVFYKPYPDSAWREISKVLYPGDFELDTANVDRAGEPELLLTEPYRRRGSPDAGDVHTLYVLRVGARIDTLFKSLVYCSDYHHAWLMGNVSGELYNIGQSQRVTAGYGFVRVGPVRTTCEQHRMPRPVPCRCDAQDLADAGNPRFARPGRYRWQHGQLRRVAAR